MQLDFDLSKEVMDQIIFGMENQENRFYLDLETATVVQTPVNHDAGEFAEDRYCEIPRWQSVDGFNLMERFVGDLKNPLAKQELHRILQSGRGVFRNYKNCLKEYREVERLWYHFKDSEMKKTVLRWFNQIRESRGLEALEEEEVFDSEDLILSDFGIRPINSSTEYRQAVLMDRRAFLEQYEEENLASYWYSFRRDHLPDMQNEDDGCVVLGVFTPDGDLSGVLWALHDEVDSRRAIAHILQLYVVPQYRGLGMAGTLLDEYLQKIVDEDVCTVLIENPASTSFLSPMLTQRGFVEGARSYIHKLSGD